MPVVPVVFGRARRPGGPGAALDLDASAVLAAAANGRTESAPRAKLMKTTATPLFLAIPLLVLGTLIPDANTGRTYFTL